MRSVRARIRVVTALLSLCVLAIGPALAQGQGQGQGQGQNQERRQEAKYRFDDAQRSVVRNYYQEAANNAGPGGCPPGLAKKQNGCMPPGQVRKWEMGRQLPRDVTYYSVPDAISQQLGMAPEGHKYVRVASDILLITETAGVVIDAILGQ